MNYRKLPIVGGLFYAAPQNFLHINWQNQIGHQFIRYFFYNFLYAIRIRPKFYGKVDQLETLKKDGILAWNNFFTDKQWEVIKKEFSEVRKTMLLKPYYSKTDPGILMGITEISEKSETYKLIANNDILNDYAGYIVRRDTKKFAPSLSYMVIERDPHKDYDDDLENILHADTFYPTAKAFVYLSDVNEVNAPYVYAKGTQKFTFKRGLYEYNMSVRVSKLANGDNKSIPQDALLLKADKQRNIITESQKKYLNIHETYYPGNENSVIISNNIGFHRRGEFQKGGCREIILINYRYAATSLLRRALQKFTRSR